MAGFQGLTFVVQPVTTSAGVLNTNIVAGTSRVAGILDPAGGLNRMYNPTAVGFAPVTGTDTAATWLPIVTSIAASSVNDQYWTPTFVGTQTGATVVNPNTKIGQVQLVLTAATADTVRASSVMNFRLSQYAFVIIATGTF